MSAIPAVGYGFATAAATVANWLALLLFAIVPLPFVTGTYYRHVTRRNQTIRAPDRRRLATANPTATLARWRTPTTSATCRSGRTSATRTHATARVPMHERAAGAVRVQQDLRRLPRLVPDAWITRAARRVRARAGGRPGPGQAHWRFPPRAPGVGRPERPRLCGSHPPPGRC